MLTAKRSLKGLVAILAAMSLFTIGGAQAAEVEASFVLTAGVIDLPNQDFELPATGSTGITGTYDDVTGDFDGEFIIAQQQVTQTVTSPAAGTIDLIISMEALPVTGTIDPATGEVNLETSLSVSLHILTFDADPPGDPLVTLDVTCVMEPIDLVLTSQPDGTDYDPVPVDPDNVEGTFEVTAEGFTVPAGVCTDGSVPGASALVQGPLNTTLGLPTSETLTSLAFETGEVTPAPPISTTTAPPTTAPATAPAARVTTASPTFTG